MRSLGPRNLHLPGLHRGLGDLGKADLLEDLLQVGGGVDVGGGHVGADAATHQLFAAAPAGDQADAELDETDVGFGVGHDAVGAHADLRAAAQGHVEGGRHHGFGGLTQGKDGLLAFGDDGLQFGPHARLGAHAHLQEVGPHAEVGPVVGDDQTGGAAVQTLHGLAHEGDDVAVQSVHLGAELQQHDAVAHVQQAGGVVLGDGVALVASHIGHPLVQGAGVDGFILTGQGAVGHLCVVFIGIEGGNLFGHHFLDPRSHFAAFTF